MGRGWSPPVDVKVVSFCSLFLPLARSLVTFAFFFLETPAPQARKFEMCDKKHMVRCSFKSHKSSKGCQKSVKWYPLSAFFFF